MNSKKQLSPSILWMAMITGTILLIPLISMQFSNEVAWTISDFTFAGTLIFGTGLTYKIVTRESEKLVYRSAVGIALLTGFILIWANGAVGIIGSESNPINMAYYGVIFIGLLGTIISRLQPKGMALSMVVTAIAQSLVTATVLLGGFYQSPASSVTEILGINTFFIVLWCVSALLFRNAVNGDELREKSVFNS